MTSVTSTVRGLPVEVWQVVPSWRGSTEAWARGRRAPSKRARAVVCLVYIWRAGDERWDVGGD